MKISIIVPIFNSSQTVVRALESIRQQTYQNYEVIVIDDGSTDDSYSIVNSYKRLDGKLKVLKLSKNSGVNRARNFGLENISKESDLVTFLDSDDEFFSTALEDIQQVIGENNSYSDYCFSVVNNEGSLCSFIKSGERAYTYDEVLSNKKLIQGEWVHAVRASIVRNGEFKYCERVKNGFESLLYLNITSKYQTFYSRKVVRKYYIDNPSLTRAVHYSKEKVLDICLGYKLLLSEHGSKMSCDRVQFSRTLATYSHFKFMLKSYDSAFFMSFKALLYFPFQLRVYRNFIFFFMGKYRFKGID